MENTCFDEQKNNFLFWKGNILFYKPFFFFLNLKLCCILFFSIPKEWKQIKKKGNFLLEFDFVLFHDSFFQFSFFELNITNSKINKKERIMKERKKSAFSLFIFCSFLKEVEREILK